MFRKTVCLLSFQWERLCNINYEKEKMHQWKRSGELLYPFVWSFRVASLKFSEPHQVGVHFGILELWWKWFLVIWLRPSHYLFMHSVLDVIWGDIRSSGYFHPLAQCWKYLFKMKSGLGNYSAVKGVCAKTNNLGLIVRKHRVEGEIWVLKLPTYHHTCAV